MQPAELSGSEGGLQLVDVREPEEWTAGRIDGSVHIPMGEVVERVGEIRDDEPVVVICRSGARSDRVAQFLRRQGYDAHNLEGGLQAWAAEGLALVAEGGGPGTVA